MQEQLVNEIAKVVMEQLRNVDVYNTEDRIPIGVSARRIWRRFLEKAMNSIRKKI